MIVVDTNVIAALWVPNNMERLIYKLLNKDTEWVAPTLWRSEFRSVLTLYLRKNILDLATVIQAMNEAEAMMKANTFEVNSTQIFQKISTSNCSAYDCEFVALAAELNVPLLTFDKKICQEFPTIAVSPESFV